MNFHSITSVDAQFKIGRPPCRKAKSLVSNSSRRSGAVHRASIICTEIENRSKKAGHQISSHLDGGNAHCPLSSRPAICEHRPSTNSGRAEERGVIRSNNLRPPFMSACLRAPPNFCPSPRKGPCAICTAAEFGNPGEYWGSTNGTYLRPKRSRQRVIAFRANQPGL
jgi:hypothetical protein